MENVVSHALIRGKIDDDGNRPELELGWRALRKTELLKLIRPYKDRLPAYEENTSLFYLQNNVAQWQGQGLLPMWDDLRPSNDVTDLQEKAGESHRLNEENIQLRAEIDAQQYQIDRQQEQINQILAATGNAPTEPVAEKPNGVATQIASPEPQQEPATTERDIEADRLLAAEIPGMNPMAAMSQARRRGIKCKGKKIAQIKSELKKLLEA